MQTICVDVAAALLIISRMVHMAIYQYIDILFAE